LQLVAVAIDPAGTGRGNSYDRPFLFPSSMKMTIAVTGALCAAAVTTAAIAAKPTTRNRAEIPAEYRGDFSAIYPTWAAWEEGMKEMDARMDAFAKLKGT